MADIIDTPRDDDVSGDPNVSWNAADEIVRLRTALHEIDWLCEGRADIDWNGGPNLAMQIQEIVASALVKCTKHST